MAFSAATALALAAVAMSAWEERPCREARGLVSEQVRRC